MPYKEGRQWRATPKYKGKRLQTKLFQTKSAASEWERKKKKEARKAEKVLQKGLDLLSFCSKYKIYAERYVPKTYDEKCSLIKRILKVWGGKRVVETITSQDIETYLRDQKKLRSANASNRDRKNLHAMWVKGISSYGLRSNPISETEKYGHDRKPQYTPPVEDVLKVLMVATRSERIFLDAFIQTGGRKSEIFRWIWTDDIDFNQRRVRLGSRKTRDGSMKYRWIKMSDSLYNNLKWLWDNRPFKENPHVFVDDTSDPKHPHYGKSFTSRQKFMKGLCKRASVRSFGFHALRRFVASVLIDKASLKQVQLVLGHASIQTTDRYIHNLKKDQTETMNTISETLEEVSEKLEKNNKVHISGTQNGENGES